MNDIFKIIKSLEDSNVLIDGITDTVKHEIRKQEGRFLSALLAPFTASLVQPLISSVVKAINGRIMGRAETGYINKKFLAPLHRLSNIGIANYFIYEPKFNGAFSRNNLPRIKNGAYIINLDDKKTKGALWVSLFINKNTAVYFDSLGTEYIPQEV